MAQPAAVRVMALVVIACDEQILGTSFILHKENISIILCNRWQQSGDP